MEIRKWLLLVLSISSALMSACTRDDQPEPAPLNQSHPAEWPVANSWAALPPPSRLHIDPGAGRSVSYVEGDLTISGSDYSTALPSQLVTVQSNALAYAPAYPGPSGTTPE